MGSATGSKQMGQGSLELYTGALGALEDSSSGADCTPRSESGFPASPGSGGGSVRSSELHAGSSVGVPDPVRSAKAAVAAFDDSTLVEDSSFTLGAADIISMHSFGQKK